MQLRWRMTPQHALDGGSLFVSPYLLMFVSLLHTSTTHQKIATLFFCISAFSYQFSFLHVPTISQQFSSIFPEQPHAIISIPPSVDGLICDSVRIILVSPEWDTHPLSNSADRLVLVHFWHDILLWQQVGWQRSKLRIFSCFLLCL